MPDPIVGPLEFLNGKSKITIVIEGDGASIKVGGEGTDGRISVVDGAGKEVFQLKTDSTASLSLGGEGHFGQLIIMDDKGQLSSMVAGSSIQVGNKGAGGHLLVKHADDSQVFLFNSFGAELSLGANGHPGKLTVVGGSGPNEGDNGRLIVQDNENKNAFQVSGSQVRLGSEGHPGDLRILDDKGTEWFMVNTLFGANVMVGTKGKGGNILVRHFDGSQVLSLYGNASVSVGANEHAGSVTINGAKDPSKEKSGKLTVKDNEGRDVFQVKGSELRLGAKGAGARFSIDDGSGVASIYLNDSILHLGKQVVLQDDNGKETIKFDGGTGDITVGANGNAGSIKVLDSSGNEKVKIFGESGDIELVGADCAEEFDLLAEAGAEPATVMVIDAAGGKLRPCDEAYDKKVAGVISGGGILSPGITLDKQGGEGRSPVALAGKVMCKVDARYAPIEIGDLLTTSPTVGHAMRVKDHAQAFGAVIGKALRPLKAGAGLIPILIALQ